ncbi:Vacuolar protein sorting-associated protein 52 A [Raphanus sativus]|nr:Vacuolar protein sorting-associated protein 52 A [Raphanus sativus]
MYYIIGQAVGDFGGHEKLGFDLGAYVGDLAFEEDSVRIYHWRDFLQQELEECESDEDYIKESDNLVSLHDQIHDCDRILSQMETLLSGFQEEIGSVSSDIKILQETSMEGLGLKNRRVAESKLAKFVEDIIVPPKMIDVIVDGELGVDAATMCNSITWYSTADPAVKSSKALKDVEPELEKLRQQAISKVYDFIVQKLIALRKPKTNIQILQQSVLLKYK